jgi:hypothetical protein
VIDNMDIVFVIGCLLLVLLFPYLMILSFRFESRLEDEESGEI